MLDLSEIADFAENCNIDEKNLQKLRTMTEKALCGHESEITLETARQLQKIFLDLSKKIVRIADTYTGLCDYLFRDVMDTYTFDCNGHLIRAFGC